MTDDHEVGPPGDLDPEQLARAIVTRPGMYIGVPPTAEVVRAFISGLDLAVVQSGKTSPLAADDHRRLQDPSTEDIEAVKPVIAQLLTALCTPPG